MFDRSRLRTAFGVVMATILAIPVLGFATQDSQQPPQAPTTPVIDCGRNGKTKQLTSTGSYGPGISQASAQAACDKAAAAMLPGNCKGCKADPVTGVVPDGCDRGEAYSGGTCSCTVDQLPNVTPPTWFANYDCSAASMKGWVSCSNCDV